MQWRVSLPLVVLSGVMTAGQDTPDAHLGRGYEALKLERYEQAVTEFRGSTPLSDDCTITELTYRG